MEFMDWILYKELIARIKSLPGALEPEEERILNAIDWAIGQHWRDLDFKTGVQIGYEQQLGMPVK